ncbi:class I SAM-dependent methyltransferase [Parerythrobacter aurantius]|uniref:class I SAM-dependent methyltransferase n=1 Tax=Parerythrobacter aurantius TaxID=3127706 RepID=UPI0032459462
MADPKFEAQIFGRRVNYFECDVCRYVQTERPDWLDQAYESAINVSDTGILLRNRANVGIVLATLSCLKARSGKVVDCAGGYGVLVRLLRDAGVEALWSDPYCQNLFALGFEHDGGHADLVTAFEAFEHFVEPMEDIGKLFTVAPNLLVSTELAPEPTPKPHEWWYYGLDHGQHIGFFRLATLEWIARRLGKHLVSDGRNYHLFSDKKVSATQWQMACRLAGRLPFVFSRGLPSKVWTDFERMSQQKGG